MRCWDRAREASLETVTCSWNVCGVMRTERQEGTCRADTRSRHADSGLFQLFVIVAKMKGDAADAAIYLNVFYDVMMTLPAAAKAPRPKARGANGANRNPSDRKKDTACSRHIMYVSPCPILWAAQRGVESSTHCGGLSGPFWLRKPQFLQNACCGSDRFLD